MAEQKHHYIPEFYLKQWAGQDHRLFEFCRRHRDIVVARPTFPGGTGYVRGLYSMRAAPPHLKDIFEDRFMSVADGVAATSLQLMIDDRYVPTGPQKIAWTRFIMSLWYRTPEGIARSTEMVRKYFESRSLEHIQSEYDKVKEPDDPPTPEEYIREQGDGMVERTLIHHLMDIIESEKVRDKIMSMQWHVGWFDNLKHPLITGDRPIIMTDGLAFPDSHLVMPLSPKYIFIAANTDEEVAKIKALSRSGELAKRMNDRIARQARKFVFASDTTQLHFIEKRLGQKVACSPFE